MKKTTILIALSLSLLASCGKNKCQQKKLTVNNPSKLKQIIPYEVGVGAVHTLEINGHSYVIWNASNGGGTMFHEQGCKSKH